MTDSPWRTNDLSPTVRRRLEQKKEKNEKAAGPSFDELAEDAHLESFEYLSQDVSDEPHEEVHRFVKQTLLSTGRQFNYNKSYGYPAWEAYAHALIAYNNGDRESAAAHLKNGLEFSRDLPSSGDPKKHLNVSEWLWKKIQG